MKKMSGKPIISELYCGSSMLHKYRMECDTEYEKSIPLQVLQVKDGIVHPLPTRGDLSNERSGGVTDLNSKFIELSLTKRVSPPNFFCEEIDWYCGASQNFQLEKTDYVDEDVVFLGALSSHFGHFITEGLARLWFFLDKKHAHYKGVYISDARNNKFIDCFRFFGIKDQNLLEITKPTRFRLVIIPEQSIRLQDFYHSKYKQTIDKIKEKIIAAQYAKVFFSKAKSQNGRGIGELPIQSVFEKNGFAIFYPEKMTMYETISVLKGCDEFVATSGTNIHNSVFMNDGKAIICLNRSAHFHPLQIMIDRMKSLKTTYIDVFLFSTDGNFGDAPCFVAITVLLRKYFNDKNFSYNGIHLFAITPLYLMRYLSFPLYQDIYQLYFGLTKSKCKSIRIAAAIFRKIKRFLL